MVIRMEAGRPGRLTISVDPRMPAVWRDKIAVGTCFKLSMRISSPKPGISRVQAAIVPSGVRSRGAGPVLDAQAYADLAKPSSAVAPFTYRAVVPNLFNGILSAGMQAADQPQLTHPASQRTER